MQKNLLIDHLDPSQCKDHGRYFQLTLWRGYLAKINFEELYAESGNVSIHHSVPSEIIKDKGWMEFARTWNIYNDKAGKPYVFSPYLTKILQNTTTTDLTYEDIPDEFYGYIELPGLTDEYGKEILGIFVTVFKDQLIEGKTPNNEKLIKIVAITDEGKISSDLLTNFDIAFPPKFLPRKAKLLAVNWLFIGLTPGQAFARAVENVKITNNFTFSPESFNLKEESFWKHTLLNCLTFIRYCTDQTISTFNQFASKNSKAIVERALHTEKEFFYCDLERKIFKIDSTFVKGHFRWQPYGVKRSKKKLIYIAPGKRTYNKKPLQG